MLFEVRRAAAAIADVLRVDAPAAEPPVAVDQAALAEAEAAYAAPPRRPALRAAARRRARGPRRPSPTPAPVARAASPPSRRRCSARRVGRHAYHPDTPLEPTPGLGLGAAG